MGRIEAAARSRSGRVFGAVAPHTPISTVEAGVTTFRWGGCDAMIELATRVSPDRSVVSPRFKSSPRITSVEDMEQILHRSC